MSQADLEAEFMRLYVPKRQGRTLIVGSKVYKFRKDRRKEYLDCVGIDMEPGEGVDIVCDLTDPDRPSNIGTFNHIECWSALEHCKQPWVMARNLECMLRKNGTIHVQVPFVWRVHAYPDDYWRFTTSGIRQLFPNVIWSKLMYAHEILQAEGKVPILQSTTQHKYIARCEVYGFGVKS